jgi:hypothetical protein
LSLFAPNVQLQNDGPELRAIFERSLATIKCLFYEFGVGHLFKIKTKSKQYIDKIKVVSLLKHTLAIINLRD